MRALRSHSPWQADASHSRRGKMSEGKRVNTTTGPACSHAPFGGQRESHVSVSALVPHPQRDTRRETRRNPRLGTNLELEKFR